jgi:hypothetical protein
MTPKEAARELDISYPSVLYHIKVGGLKAEKKGRYWDVDPESVAAWEPPERDWEVPGRPPRPDSLTASEKGARSIYLGLEITPEQIVQIRQSIAPDLRGRIMLRMAEMEMEELEQILDELGVQHDRNRAGQTDK